MPLTSKDFGWLDNYYIWDAITSAAFGGGATQDQIWEIFNGYAPAGQDPAIALFESQSGVFNSLANLLFTDGKSGAEYLKGIFDTAATIEGDLSSNKQPYLISSSTTGTLANNTHSVSIYNSGVSNGTVTVNGGSAVTLKSGVTLNFDAGGVNCKFQGGKFQWDATGTTFIISYVE